MTVNGSKFPQYTYQIKLVVKPGPSFNDGGSVHHQAGSTLDLGQVTSRNGRGRLEINSNFETSRAPVNKLDPFLLSKGEDCGINVLRGDVATIK
jgi:hypothetical protein